MLGAFPIFWAFVVPYPGRWGVMTHVRQGDVGGIAFTGLIGFWLLVPGLAAFRTLLAAMGPGGLLEQIGASTISSCVPESVVASLRWWQRFHCCLYVVITMVLSVHFFLLASWYASSPDQYRIRATFIFWMFFIVIWMFVLYTWWFSLKVASALVQYQVDETTTSCTALISTTHEYNVESPVANEVTNDEWRASVELPTLRLAEKTLPTLSKGWGLSVGLVGIGWVVGAVAWYTFFHHTKAFDTSKISERNPE